MAATAAGALASSLRLLPFLPPFEEAAIPPARNRVMPNAIRSIRNDALRLTRLMKRGRAVVRTSARAIGAVLHLTRPFPQEFPETPESRRTHRRTLQRPQNRRSSRQPPIPIGPPRLPLFGGSRSPGGVGTILPSSVTYAVPALLSITPEL
jgi:hypothetical protein